MKHHKLNDPHNLERFLKEQDRVYTQVLEELKCGQKRSHWMWFIFPQMAGLGRSSTSHYFGIKSREEALAYLEHPVLGNRLKECSRLLLEIEGNTASEIFGFPDNLKLKSCMTLFATVTNPGFFFERILDKYFDGIYELIGILFFQGIKKIEDIILCPPAIFRFQSAMPYPASS